MYASSRLRIPTNRTHSQRQRPVVPYFSCFFPRFNSRFLVIPIRAPKRTRNAVSTRNVLETPAVSSSEEGLLGREDELGFTWRIRKPETCHVGEGSPGRDGAGHLEVRHGAGRGPGVLVRVVVRSPVAAVEKEAMLFTRHPRAGAVLVFSELSPFPCTCGQTEHSTVRAKGTG